MTIQPGMLVDMDHHFIFLLYLIPTYKIDFYDVNYLQYYVGLNLIRKTYFVINVNVISLGNSNFWCHERIIA